MARLPLPQIEPSPEIRFRDVLLGIKSFRFTNDEISEATGVSVRRIDALMHGPPAFYDEGSRLLALFSKLGAGSISSGADSRAGSAARQRLSAIWPKGESSS